MKNFKKVLSLALVVLMVIGAVVVAPVDAKAEDVTYTKVTSVSDITAGGSMIIVASLNGKNYALPTSISSKINATVEVTITDGKITGSNLPVWTVATGTATNSVTLSNGTSYLGWKSSTDFNTTSEDWIVTASTVESGLFRLISSDSKSTTTTRAIAYQYKGTTSRFGPYSAGMDTVSSNVNNSYEYQADLMIFKAGTTSSGSGSGGTTEPNPDATLTTISIADALKTADNTECKVKGVVTLVEGQNIYIQDATGGIALRFSEAPTDIELGDTIEATGKKSVYNGLTQLASATYTESTGLTLESKTTTIDALTDADVATYVKLTGLTVTEVFDNDGQYSKPNITVSDGTNTIQIYKAVVEKVGDEWAVKVGDKIDVLAAVGIYKTTLQLRNTLTTEITVVPQGEGDTDNGTDNGTNNGSDNNTNNGTDNKIPEKGDNFLPMFVVLFAGAALVTVAVVGKKRMA